jgi:hypothetical protein
MSKLTFMPTALVAQLPCPAPQHTPKILQDVGTPGEVGQGAGAYGKRFALLLAVPRFMVFLLLDQIRRYTMGL